MNQRPNKCGFHRRRAVEIIVETALAKQVSALVIAGDLFDGPVRDASSALWIDSQFRRLTSANIPVVLIRGNHDALSNASQERQVVVGRR